MNCQTTSAGLLSALVCTRYSGVCVPVSLCVREGQNEKGRMTMCVTELKENKS